MSFVKTVFYVLIAMGLFHWFYATELKACKPSPTSVQLELPRQAA